MDGEVFQRLGHLGGRHRADHGVAVLATCAQGGQHGQEVVFHEQHRDDDDVAAGDVDAQGRFSVDRCSCTGLCDQGPSLLVNHQQVVTRLTHGRVAALADLRDADTPMQALEGADALIIVPEWKAYRSPDFERMRASMRQPLILDGRNLYDPKFVRASGIEYFAIGR